MRRLALLAVAACGAPPAKPLLSSQAPADWRTLARRARDEADHGNLARARATTAEVLAAAARDGVTPQPRVIADLVLGVDSVIADATGARFATILPPRRGPKDFAFAIVWSTARGRDLYRLPRVTSLAFDRDGHVITGDLDGKVVLRDAATGGSIRELGTLSDPAQWIGVTSDDKILATDGFKIHLWDEAGANLHEWPGPPTRAWGEMAHYELSADGDTLVALTETDQGWAYVTWSLADPARPAVVTPLASVGMPTGALAVSPDGTRGAFGITSDPPSVELVDLAAHHTLVRLRNTPNAALAFRDEDTLVALGARLEQWSLHDGKRLASDPVPVAAQATAFARDGGLAIAATGSDLAIMPVDEVHVASRFGHVGGGGAIAWSPDGTQLAIGDRGGHVAVWHVTTDEAPQVREVTGRVTALALDAAGDLAAASDDDREERIVAWSPDGTRVLDADSGAFDAVVFDHGNLVGATQYGEVSAWDANHQPLDPAPKIQLDVRGHATLGTLRAETDNQRVIVRRQSDDRVVSILRHDSEVIALAGRDTLLATALHDGTIALWNPATGASLGTLVGPRDAFATVALALRPDGRTLATSREDGMVELWDLPSRTRVAELALGDAGHWLAIGGDGHVDGEPGGAVPLTWELGDTSLPGTLAWQAMTERGVVAKLLAAPAPAVDIAPVPAAARAAATCMPQGEHEVARIDLAGSTLSLCYMQRPDDAWCFDLDLATGVLRPVVPDLEIQAAKIVEEEITRHASTLWVSPHPAPRPAAPVPPPRPPRYTAALVDEDNQPGLVEIRDGSTGKRIRRIKLDEEEQHATVQIWDDQLMVTTWPCAGPCAYSTLYDIATGKRLAAVGGDESHTDTYVFDPTFMHDHVYAFPGGEAGGGAIVYQDMHTGHVIARVGAQQLGLDSGHSWLSTEQLRTPAGTLLVVGNNDESGYVWELDGTGKLLRKWRLPACPEPPAP